MHGLVPILDRDVAFEFELRHFGGDEAREWAAMRAAGRGVALGVLADFAEIGPVPSDLRVLVLAGKGHNGGDALLAAAELATRVPGARIDLALAFPERELRPLARRAFDALPADVRRVGRTGDLVSAYDVVLDGLLGLRFRAPLSEEIVRWLRAANALDARLRAAVDLPSGLDLPEAFRADFTYATGMVKRPLPDLPNAGRVRWVDLGFPLPAATAGSAVITRAVLDPLRGLRPPQGDKRAHGHLLIVAGSRRYPGAALMAVLAALHGGAGLVTAAVPESLVPAFAARAPEAIWLGLPETPEGGLALEGLAYVRAAFARATAVVIGSGLSAEAETLALAREIVALSPRPVLIDADALRPAIVMAGVAPRILTPHAGELARVADVVPEGAVLVRKGPVTRVERAGRADAPVAHSLFGGPVLARGGSGDLLAGLIGALLAQMPDDLFGAAVRGVAWHGLAADGLARAEGATAVRVTRLLDFLAPMLRG